MPTREALCERIWRPIRKNLRWLSRHSPNKLMGADLDQEASAIALDVIGTLKRGCDCAKRWPPPERPRERDFWTAVRRCECTHQITLQDLVKAGILPTPKQLFRSLAGSSVMARVDGAGCAARVDLGGRSWRLLAEVIEAALADCFPDRWPYSSDRTFWRRYSSRGTWAPLDEDDLPRLEPGTTLRGYYLGYQVDANLTAEGWVKGSWADEPYPSLSAAAAAAREHVVAVLQPQIPWAEWVCGPQDRGSVLENQRAQFWEQLLEPDFDNERWLQTTCHHNESGQQISLNDFFIHAAVGSMLPQAHDFCRSIMFSLTAYPDGTALDYGEVLRCAVCDQESDGRPCQNCLHNNIQPPPLTTHKSILFPRGTRILWPAWRCLACGNYWYAADPRPGAAETCPRCDGNHYPRPTIVWRPKQGLSVAEVEWYQAWHDGGFEEPEEPPEDAR